MGAYYDLDVEGRCRCDLYLGAFSARLAHTDVDRVSSCRHVDHWAGRPSIPGDVVDDWSCGAAVYHDPANQGRPFT